jgi:hypothetical protein
MPWQECHKVDERLRFVARVLDREKVAVLCREFEISRKIGYKIFSRYKDCGVEGLTDRSRRPLGRAGFSRRALPDARAIVPPNAGAVEPLGAKSGCAWRAGGAW